MAKRARHEGSVFKRTRRGRVEWVAEVQVGFGPNGKPRKRTLYAATQKAACGKLEELRAKVRQGVDLAAGRQRLADYLTAWLDAGAERWKPGTLANYRDLVDLHVKPYLIAGRPLEKVQPMHILQWHAELRDRMREAWMLQQAKKREARRADAGATGAAERVWDERIGARTRQAAHAMLRAAFGDAVRMNALLFNPASRVEPPRALAGKRVAIDREDILQLLAAAQASPYEAAFVLAAVHGLRVGEILGLTWGDVDLRARVVLVHRQLVEERRTGKRGLAEVKTAAGKREVPLSERAVAALERTRARLGAVLPHPERLVFTDAKATPLRRSNFHRRVWVPVRKAAELPAGTRFHDLRHAAASALLGAGQDVATVSGTLGHSGPHVTLRVYAHALPSRKREAAEKLDALYGA